MIIPHSLVVGMAALSDAKQNSPSSKVTFVNGGPVKQLKVPSSKHGIITTFSYVRFWQLPNGASGETSYMRVIIGPDPS
jgi:hypothetical protein